MEEEGALTASQRDAQSKTGLLRGGQAGAACGRVS
jgi:hypothetical protein